MSGDPDWHTLTREELERIEMEVMSVGCTDANARKLIDHGKAALDQRDEALEALEVTRGAIWARESPATSWPARSRSDEGAAVSEGVFTPRNTEIRLAIDRARRAQAAVARADELEHRLQLAHVSLSKMKRRRDALLAGTARGWWHPAARHLHTKGFTYQQIADIFDVRFDTVRVACNPSYRRRKLDKDKSRKHHLRAVA